MIEAVNSVLSSAPLLRQNAEQQSGAALNPSTTPEAVRVVAQAPYISPFVSVDVNFDTAVILFRDSETGDTVQQIPSEGALEAQRRQETIRQLENLQSQTATTTAPDTVSSETVNNTSQDASFVSAAPPAANGNPPITQAVLSAFQSGAQTSVATSSSFTTSA